jgi:hypothetical protein
VHGYTVRKNASPPKLEPRFDPRLKLDACIDDLIRSSNWEKKGGCPASDFLSYWVGRDGLGDEYGESPLGVMWFRGIGEDARCLDICGVKESSPLGVAYARDESEGKNCTMITRHEKTSISGEVSM